MSPVAIILGALLDVIAPAMTFGLYLRIPRLLHDLATARGDGRSPKHLASFANTGLLVLDGFGLAQLDSDHRRDLLEDR